MKTVLLGDICELINRGVSPVYTNSSEGVLVLNQKCIRDHTIDYSLGRKHDLKKKKVNLDRFIKKGDVLINSTGHGTLGRVAQVRELNENVTVDSHVTIVRPKADTFYLPFFGYAMTTIEKELENAATGTSGQTELPRTTLRDNFQITYPESLQEQKRIVKKLDEVFAAIDKAKENTEKNIKNVQELLKSETYRCFLEDGASDFKTLEEVTELVTDYVANGSFASLKENVTYKREKDYAILLRLIDSSRNFNGDFVYVDRQAYDFLKKSSLRPNDIIISNVGARLGTLFRAPDLGLPMTLGPNSILIRSEKYGDYLYEWLKSSYGQKEIKDIVSGAGQPKFNKTEFRNIRIPIPQSSDKRLAVCKKIEALTTQTRKLQKLYQKKLNDLEELRQSYLHQAFKGKL